MVYFNYMEFLGKKGSGEKQTNSELFDISDVESVRQIRDLEAETFDWDVSEDDLNELEKKVENPTNITMLIRDLDRKVAGYVIAIPSIVAKEDLEVEDKLFEGSENKIYIDTLAISAANRGSISQFKDLFSKLIDEAKDRSYDLISAHIPTHHLPLYKRFSEVQVLRTLENWFDSGEDHYYIEVKI